MTEPIIINGVDVSECENFVNNYMYKNSCNKASYITKCEIGNNCHYKQLQRKEKEFKELKNKLEKAENNCIKVFNLFSELGEKYKKLKRESEKYKKCINDIKIINKDLLNDLCDNCGWHNTDGCDPEDYVCGSLIKIKQIISEVKNGINN